MTPLPLCAAPTGPDPGRRATAWPPRRRALSLAVLLSIGASAQTRVDLPSQAAGDAPDSAAADCRLEREGTTRSAKMRRCVVRVGSQLVDVSFARLTIQSVIGHDLVKVWLQNGSLVAAAQAATTVLVGQGIIISTPVSAVPSDGVPVASWQITYGVPGDIKNLMPRTSADILQPGFGLVGYDSSTGVKYHAVDTAVIPTVLIVSTAPASACDRAGALRVVRSAPRAIYVCDGEAWRRIDLQ